MRRPLLIALAAIGLAACASTPTLYQPASAPGAVGYTEAPIEHDRWRVTFQGGDGASVQQVSDLAIRRAAELTLSKGYDWFRLAGRDIESAPDGVRPDISLGFGGADFGGGRSAVGMGGGLGFDFGGPSRAVTVTLEILMGQGPAPREPDVYDAREVRRSLGGVAA
jgi:hypothetical protein